MNFACLYMPDFLLQANLREEPALFAQPVALVDGSSSYPRVIAATPKARETGILLGMTRTEAAQFACIRHRSIVQEESTHAALLTCARSSSPRIEDTAQDTVILDLTGLEHLLGPPSKIASCLLERAEVLGLRIHLAFAKNPDTAILSARGFPGVTIIPPGEEARKLGELPVRLLCSEPEIIEALARWGIHRLKELAGLPTLPLSERLGQEGVRLQKLACGRHFRALVIAPEAERFEEAWELETPATTLNELEFVFSSLLTRLTKRLAMRSLAALAIRLQLDLVKGMEPEPIWALEKQTSARADKKTVCDHSSSPVSDPSSLKYERTLSFPVPINNAPLFLKLWRLRLESDLPKGPVIKVRITAQPARPRALQGGLFAPLAPDPEKLELTLARIAAVVGRENVGSPEIPDTHQPHTFRVIPFNSDGSKSKSVVRRQGDFSASTMVLRVFRPPVPVRVELAGGRPLRLLSSQVRGRITFAAGPWLKSGGWWEEEKWDREEWDIEIRSRKTPALYSIYYDRIRDEWYLQGEYD